MKQRDEKYHVKINPEFLFDIKNKFKSFYAPWVYAYLKLDYNNYLDNAQHSFYKIDRKSICEFFGFHNSTLTRVFDRLIKNKLLEEKGSEYRLLNDKDVFLYEKNEEEGQLPEFVQIYNNFFIDFIKLLRESFEEFKKQPRAMIKVVQVFYYLITKNHHVMTDIPRIYSKETVKSISSDLHHDENFVKGYLGVLETIGYIEYDIDGNIFNVYSFGTSKPFKKTIAQPFNKRINNTEETEQVQNNDYSRGDDEVKVVEQPKPVPVPDMERIGYILSMGNGDAKKTKELLDRFHISEESFGKYLATY